MLKVRVDCDRLCPGRTGQTTLTQRYLCKMTQKLKQQRGQTVTMPKSPDGGEKKEKKIQRVTLCMNLHFFLNLIVTQAVFLLSVQYAGIGWIQL